LSRTFGFGEEWIPVGPYFEMMGQAFVAFVKVFDEDDFLIRIAAPPFVAVLEISVGVFRACLARFPGPGRAVIPEVFDFRVFELPFLKADGVVMFQQARIVEPDLVGDFFKVAFFGGFQKFLPPLLFRSADVSFRLGCRTTFQEVTFFLTVGNRSKEVFADFDRFRY